MLEVLVVCEAEADFRIATDLADRVCKVHAPDWAADNLQYRHDIIRHLIDKHLG